MTTPRRSAEQASEPNRVASRARGRRRRELIIEVATALMLQKGYDGLVLRDVAAGADIHIGTLNHYFGTKQELLLAIFDQQSAEYAVKMRLAVAKAADTKRQVEAIISIALDELRKPQNALWRILVALAQHDPEAAKLLRRENDLYHQSVATELQRIRPELSTSRAKTLGRLIWAILDGYSLQVDRFQLSASGEDEISEADLVAAVSGIVHLQ